MTTSEIIKQLPYKKPFLFVDELESVNENGSSGVYQIKEDEYFFQGHFPSKPVTPGVIVTEIMAQIGLVCLGIYLKSQQESDQSIPILPVFSSVNVEYLAPALPGDILEVKSEKIYFRFNKLKCRIRCFNRNSGKEICRGEFSGMVINENEFGSN